MKTLAIDIETYSSVSLQNLVFMLMLRVMILRFCSLVMRGTMGPLRL